MVGQSRIGSIDSTGASFECHPASGGPLSDQVVAPTDGAAGAVPHGGGEGGAPGGGDAGGAQGDEVANAPVADVVADAAVGGVGEGGAAAGGDAFDLEVGEWVAAAEWVIVVVHGIASVGPSQMSPR